MADDYPDGTIPVGIKAWYIGNLPVNVAAWAIGTIKVDIAAQTIGNINVNLAASAVTLNVNISASAVTLDINIKSQTANINMNIAASAVTLDINIKSQTANINMNIAASAVTLNVNITNSSITITGSVTITSGTVTFTNTTIAVTGAITITSGSVTFTNTTIAVTGSIIITSGSVTFTNTTIAVTGAVTISGPVTVTSGAVTISTVAGTNIILDLLKQSTYVDRASVEGGVIVYASNAALAVAGWTTTPWQGVLFVRGMISHIQRVGIYARSLSGTKSAVISFHSYVGSGEIFNVTITGITAAGWYWTDVKLPWLYDKVFAYVNQAIDSNLEFGYATHGNFYLTGANTWNWRKEYTIFLNLECTMQTVGDIPVSGTVNNIEIPNTSGSQQSVLASTSYGETLPIIINGSGRMISFVIWDTYGDAANYVKPRIYCDGVAVMPYDILLFLWELMCEAGAGSGYYCHSVASPYARTALIVTLPFPFKRTLQVGFYNSDVNNIHTCSIGVNYETIS